MVTVVQPSSCSSLKITDRFFRMHQLVVEINFLIHFSSLILISLLLICVSLHMSSFRTYFFHRSFPPRTAGIWWTAFANVLTLFPISYAYRCFFILHDSESLKRGVAFSPACPYVQPCVYVCPRKNIRTNDQKFT